MSKIRKATTGMSSTGTWTPLLDAIERMKQKLTCPRCNGLLAKSVLLPCNHIVCSACIIYSSEKTCVCPSCKCLFLYEGVKPAKHMDGIVILYKKVDAAIPAVICASPDEASLAKNDSDVKQGADNELSQGSYLLTSGVKECNSQRTDSLDKFKRLKRNLQMQSVVKPRYLFGDGCAFCHSLRSTEISGPMMCYIGGKLVPHSRTIESGAFLVHQKCAVWAPEIYNEGISLGSLEVELERSLKSNCSECGLSGAALGCYFPNCKKSFHVPCAVAIPECRWDFDNMCLLCPTHTSEQLPCDAIVPGKQIEEDESSLVQTIKLPSCLGKSTIKGQSSKEPNKVT